MSKRLMSVLLFCLGIMICILFLAWLDGGEQRQRMIAEPVRLAPPGIGK